MKKISALLSLVLVFGIFSSVSTLASADGEELIFELTEAEVDSFLAFLDDSSTDWGSPDGGHKFLRPAAGGGKPEFTKGSGGGIHMSNRDADWQSLDIRSDWMEPGWSYNITVEFESDDNTFFMITNTDPPWGLQLSVSDRVSTNSVLTYEMGIQNSSDGQRGVRLTTYPMSSTVDYSVKSITIYAGEFNANAIAPTWAMDIPSLYETYSDYFPIGNIMEPAQLDNEEITAMFIHQYNAVTAENAMKPGSISSAKGQYNFTNADRIVNWAIDNGIEVHGHTLVWHSQSARWLTNGADGGALTRAEAQENMREFITEYTTYFTGRVVSWDVVNEAFTDGADGSGTWRDKLRKNSPWYIAYSNGMDETAGEAPEDYIYDAFVFTRLAAPDALLVYNDFNDESPNKREAIASMVEDLNLKWLDDARNTDKDRLLIEVIGMQAHYWTNNLSTDNVRASIERFIQTGAMVAVTELDIPTGSYGSFGGDNEERLKKQADLYAELFEIYAEYSEHILRVTFWGKADRQSWRSEGYPLLFDTRLQPKDAFWRILGVVSSIEPPSGTDTPPGDVTETPIESSPPDDSTPPVNDTPVPPSAAPDDELSDGATWGIIVIVAVVILAAIAVTVVLVLRSRKK